MVTILSTEWWHRFHRPVLTLVVGVCVLQAAWVLSIPPFGGIDEIDHAHRVAGVANGQWVLTEPARDGRGWLVWVPTANIEAASRHCDTLEYVGADNCEPVKVVGDEGRIASSAGNYNPLYYAYVAISSWFAPDGAPALYGMRIATVLFGLVCLSFALIALRSWHRGTWALFGVTVALTPTVLYSASIAAPNGAEMLAALPVWLSLLGVSGEAENAKRDRRLLLIAAIFTLPLVGFRTLGPMWFAIIGLTVAVWHGPHKMRAIVTTNRLWFSTLVVSASVAAAFNVSWVLSGGRGYSGEPGVQDDGIGQAFDFVLWSAQMVGAFPYRNQPTAVWVYAVYFLILIAILTVSIHKACGWNKFAILLSLVLMLVVPMGLVLATLEDRGGEYQGRYAVPFVIGILPMMGIALDKAGFGHHEGAHLRTLGTTLMVAIHVGAVVKVATDLKRYDPSAASDASWIQAPTPIVVLLMLLGGVLLALGLRASDLEHQPDGQPPRKRGERKWVVTI